MHTSTPPWTLDQKDAAVRQGCHRSPNDHADFIREQLADFIDNQFFAVLPHHLVRHLVNLKPSPSSIKEELFRRPRLLSDHSWSLPLGFRQRFHSASRPT